MGSRVEDEARAPRLGLSIDCAHGSFNHWGCALLPQAHRGIQVRVGVRKRRESFPFDWLDLITSCVCLVCVWVAAKEVTTGDGVHVCNRGSQMTVRDRRLVFRFLIPNTAIRKKGSAARYPRGNPQQLFRSQSAPSALRGASSGRRRENSVRWRTRWHRCHHGVRYEKRVKSTTQKMSTRRATRGA
jgi:hypothetical protein